MVGLYKLASSVVLAGYLMLTPGNLQRPVNIHVPQVTPYSLTSTCTPGTTTSSKPAEKTLEGRLLPAIQEGNLTLTELYFEVSKEMVYRERFQGQNKYQTLKIINEEVNSILENLCADVYRGLEADHVLPKSAHYSDFPKAVRDDLSDYKSFVEKADSNFRLKTFKGPLILEEYIEDVQDYVNENMPEDIKYSRQLELTQRLIEIYLKNLSNALKNNQI
ncbi:MAG: hypothetical protein IH934_06395 [Nanoarchaeota archaeon]|nr:hypothetical protein [Nanoarchaeota archaeon]